MTEPGKRLDWTDNVAGGREAAPLEKAPLPEPHAPVPELEIPHRHMKSTQTEAHPAGGAPLTATCGTNGNVLVSMYR